MDPFAQSRADDDLFADDFEPVTESEAIPEPEPVYSSKPPQDVRLESRPDGGNSNGGYTARQADRRQDQRQQQHGGRGRGGNHHGMGQSRYADQTEQQSSVNTTSSKPPPPPPQAAPSNTESTPEEQSQPTTNPAPQELAGRVHAVRGDRSATGGPAHKKLTEEELTAKMEKMAIINAKKSESHRASEADQAAFQHREKELAKERREKAVVENRNARAMEMEREKNRLRKMKAQGGREWDSEKVESDMVDKKGRSSGYERGGFGGVIQGGLANSKYATKDDEESNNQSNRGGGFEIRGRGRGGGRGGRSGNRGGKSAAQTVPSQEEFPPLSSAAVASPKPGGTWAEEMATTPSEEKKTELGGEKELSSNTKTEGGKTQVS